MTIQIKTLSDLSTHWPSISSCLLRQDSKSPRIDPEHLRQHLLCILTKKLDGWIGISLDNSSVVCILILKRKLSLRPDIIEYDTLLYHFDQGYRKAFFSLLQTAYTYCESVGAKSYTLETLSPKLFLLNSDSLSLVKHTITLKRFF
jgi:hypothetical protein